MAVIVNNPWGDEETARIKCLACGTDRETFLAVVAAVRKFKEEFPEDTEAANRLFGELVELFARGYL